MTSVAGCSGKPPSNCDFPRPALHPGHRCRKRQGHCKQGLAQRGATLQRLGIAAAGRESAAEPLLRSAKEAQAHSIGALQPPLLCAPLQVLGG